MPRTKSTTKGKKRNKTTRSKKKKEPEPVDVSSESSEEVVEEVKPKVTKARKTTKPKPEKEKAEKPKRTFSVVGVWDDEGNVVELEDVKKGKFTGAPGSAGNKAFTKAAKAFAGGDECSLKITIVEKTPGSKEKQYTYIGTRKKLDTPQVIKRKTGKSETSYEVKFKNHIKAYKPETK